MGCALPPQRFHRHLPGRGRVTETPRGPVPGHWIRSGTSSIRQGLPSPRVPFSVWVTRLPGVRSLVSIRVRALSSLGFGFGGVSPCRFPCYCTRRFRPAMVVPANDCHVHFECASPTGRRCLRIGVSSLRAAPSRESTDRHRVISTLRRQRTRPWGNVGHTGQTLSSRDRDRAVARRNYILGVQLVPSATRPVMRGHDLGKKFRVRPKPAHVAGLLCILSIGYRYPLTGWYECHGLTTLVLIGP